MRVDDLHSLSSCYKKYDPEMRLKEILTLENREYYHINDFDDEEIDFKIRISNGLSVNMSVGTLVKMKSTSYIDVRYKVK